MVIYSYYRDDSHSGIGVYGTLDEAMREAYKDNERNIANVCEIVDGEKLYSFREVKEYWEKHINTGKKEKFDSFPGFNQKKNGQQTWP